MMLKVARRPRSAVIAAMAAMTLTAAVFAGLASPGAAFADHAWGWNRTPTLNEGWAPVNRCPVDDPTMLAADGISDQALCIADNAPTGSMTVGNLTVALKNSNHQFGVILGGETSPVVEPSGGGIDSEPVQLPGGVQELVCPSHGHFARQLCRGSHGGGWYGSARDATFTLESAGTPTNFNLFAGLFVGAPFASIPTKIHLQSKFLGDDCYIGSEAEPIMFQPANLAEPEPVVAIKPFKLNGEPVSEEEQGTVVNIESLATSQSSAFTVPAASGCGFRGYFDRAINEKLGLPSSASTNSVTFNENTGHVIGLAFAEEYAPNDGKELSKYWHAAVVPPERGGHGHGHGYGRRLYHRYEVENYARHWFRHGH
jgi:hypothetical protein